MRLAAAVVIATLSASGQVTYERILKAASEPANWLTYSGNYAGHRYSALDQINANNVQKLRPMWGYQTSSLQKFETTPIVVDGVMYISEPPSHVTASRHSDGQTIVAGTGRTMRMTCACAAGR
jgi:glucose dehydrogenase